MTYPYQSKKTFTKSDLKTGMVVEQRGGVVKMVLRGTREGDILRGIHGYGRLDTYNNSLIYTQTYGTSGKQFDIMKVYNQTNIGANIVDHSELLWERVEETEEDKKLRELEESIRIAQKQISEIRESRQ